MAFNTLKMESFLRRISAVSTKKYATATEAVQKQDVAPVHFRTVESNPVNHTEQHKGRFYTMPNEHSKALFSHNSLPKQFQAQVKTFAELALLVREPALEVFSYINKTDFTKPVNRYVLFGPLGCGKTMTLAHILHYGFISQKLIIHVPWAPNWYRRPKEVATSSTREGFMDLPVDAAAWLIHFKQQNGHLFPQLDLKVSKEYVWSKRETTPVGSPLTELIDLGINRLKYASEIIIALVSELKEASIAGRINTLVVIDGYNTFFTDTTRIFDDHKAMILPDRVSLTHAFLELTKYDWCNGSIVLSVDQKAVKGHEESDLPRFQLGKAGFEHTDPFVPVHVGPYTLSEFYNVMDYYKDRRWVGNMDEDGIEELRLLSGLNPYKLMNLCAPL